MRNIRAASPSALNQVMPAAISQVISPGGVMNEIWYRFFQMVWLKNSSGISNDVTLGSVSDQATTAQASADAAQSTATNAANSVEAETNRAVAAEANLQGQINATNDDLNARLDGVVFGNTAGTAGALAGYIQVTVNGTPYSLPLYNR